MTANCKWVFDFHSPHNNEYWYTCKTCGVREWFAYYGKPKDGEPGVYCKEKPND